MYVYVYILSELMKLGLTMLIKVIDKQKKSVKDTRNLHLSCSGYVILKQYRRLLFSLVAS